jgi:hypothetical protein
MAEARYRQQQEPASQVADLQQQSAAQFGHVQPSLQQSQHDWTLTGAGLANRANTVRRMDESLMRRG